MTTTLPPASTIQVATVPLAAFLARQASILAAAGTSTPAPEINFLNATVMIGDGAVGGGAPQQPSLSTLQANNALAHQVWSGQVVQSCSQDPTNPNQIDILCVIPAVDSSGNEIGPFWATEFIVTDENGTPMVAGVTMAPKLVTANGAATDLAFIVSIGFSLGTVVLTPPSAPYMTEAQIQAALANEVTATVPLAIAKTVDSAGWTHFGASIDPTVVVYRGQDSSANGNVVTVAALAPAEAALLPGQLLLITKGANPNSGPVAVTVQGHEGPATYPDSTPLISGDWPADVTALVWWDGVEYLILSGVGPSRFARLGLSGKAPGGLIDTRVIATTQIYVPTPGTGSIIGTAIGGGAAGGGAVAMSGSNFGAAGGGGAGGIAQSLLTSGFAGQLITIGAAGAGVVGAAGGNGGTTSFGALFQATGGLGGALAPDGVYIGSMQTGGAGGVGSGGNLFNGNGASGAFGAAFAIGNMVSGEGAGSPLGLAGGKSVFSSTAPGGDSTAAGAGGGGACGQAGGWAVRGGNGYAGVFVVEEYAS